MFTLLNSQPTDEHQYSILQRSISPPPAPCVFSPRQKLIEGEAVRQLYTTAKLDGMRRAVGFPDLHPGKGSPVGAAFVTEDMIYPHLIGGDIGCGMALFKRTSSGATPS